MKYDVDGNCVGFGYGRGWRKKLQPWAYWEPNVYVAKSPVHGFGLFARRDLKGNARYGEIICLYSGECVSKSALVGQADNVWVCSTFDEKGKEWCVDSRNPNNAAGR